MLKLLAAPFLMLASAGTLATPGASGPGGFVDIAVGIASIATIVGVIYGMKYKVAFEVERKAREGEAALNSALEDRIRTFAHERDDLVAKLEQLNATLLNAQKTIARLEPLNDMAKVLELVTNSFERLVNRQEQMHDENKREGEHRVERILDAIRSERAA